MADEIIIETTSAEVIEVGVPGPQGPQGAAGTGLETLTTRGDSLYRGTTTGERLPIGTTGQILRVSASGIPEWSAAPASGVTSVNGATGAVTVAAVSHSHQPGAIYCDAVDVSDTTLSSGEPNGIYFRDGSDNGKAIYKSTQGYALYWDDGEEEWVLGNVAQSAKYYIGTGDTEHPWQATSWALGPQGSGDTPVVDQALLSNFQRNAAQDAVSTRTPKTGNASSTQVVLGSDTRLSNSRTPSSHAASHAAAGGSDPLFDQDLNSDSVVSFNQITVTGSVNFDGASLNDFAFATSLAIKETANELTGTFRAQGDSLTANRTYDLPDASGTLALTTTTPASHTHGNLTNDGKVGSTSGLPLVTTTAGAVTTLALGTAGQILRTKSDLSGVEFADPAASGVTGAAASASDVLGVSGANITGVDAGSDKIVFWDDSASELTYLTVGSGLSLTDTTLTATASGGSKTYAVFTATDNQPPSTAFATLDTRNSIAVLDFDDTTDESAVFVGIMPEGASLGSGLKIRLHWMSTNQTSNNVVWDVSLERMDTDLDADSFATIASGAAAANGTSGILTVTEITLTTIDSVTAGDAFRLKVTRDANNASDNMSNDAELVAVEVRSAA